MIKLMKYLKKSAGYVVLIIALLFLQAYCDLSLPDYTSKIVNVGIQQSGIEDSVPEKIRKTSMDSLQLFMDDNDKDTVDSFYEEDGDLLVLNDISFNVKKGDFVCIVGPTGCGKTTFLNLLVKLIEPTSGQILIDGEPADPKKHNIAFVFQEPSAYPWLTVEENLQYGLKIKKVDQKTIEERTKEIAESLGLTEVLKSYPRELSASLEQRVVIGRSFALHPDLLLMDEPYAQMDIKVRYYLEDQVIKLWQKTGSTVLFITHNIEEAVYLSEKCLILSQKPTTIKEEKIIELPRPRDIASPEFIELREYVTKQIKWW